MYWRSFWYFSCLFHFYAPHMSTASVVAFDIAHVKTVIAGKERAILVCCLESLCRLYNTCYLRLHYTLAMYILPSTLYEIHGQAFFFFPHTSLETLQHLKCFRPFFLRQLFLFQHLFLQQHHYVEKNRTEIDSFPWVDFVTYLGIQNGILQYCTIPRVFIVPRPPREFS